MINHAWAAFTSRIGFPSASRPWAWASAALTFAAVCFAWVFFRATDINRATTIIQGMAGVYGVSLPDSIGNQLGSLRLLLEQSGIGFFLGGGSRFLQTYGWVALGAAVAFLLPNTQQLMDRFNPALDYRPGKDAATGVAGHLLRWRPTAQWACWIGLLTVCSLLSLNRPAEFLYFQF
jgi:hypothetical protein